MKLEKLSSKEKSKIAYEMAISALIGEDNYNFGDLLAHPILISLDDAGEYGWLRKLLFAFNSGDLHAYQQLTEQYYQQMQAESALVANADLLKQKIAILSLMELVLDRSSTNRCFTFKEIAQRSMLKDENLVEMLVMKALSLKLIKGFIDEVERKVTITWVKPRVLDLKQIGKMKDRVEDWVKKVHSTLVFIEQQTGETALQF